MKLSLLHATRGRPEKTLQIRREWLDNANHPEQVEHLYGVDADDAETIDAIGPLLRVIVLPPKGCFRAYNYAAALSSGDVLIPIEDDLWPRQGWDDMVREAMAEVVNDVAVLAVHDGQNPVIEWAVTRKFYEERGLYHDSYSGLFGDTELRTRIRQDGVRVVFAPHIVFEHRQFQPGSGHDPIYERKQSKYLDDERNFNERARDGWPA